MELDERALHPLRILRHHLGLTQTDFAQWLGYTRHYIGYIETWTPSYEVSAIMLRRILELWGEEILEDAGVTVADLLRGDAMIPREVEI